MRRLFSTFADGAPGAGLLLLRLAAGGALITRAATGLAAAALGTLVLHALIAAIGVLLVVGLWTPIVAMLAALVAVWGALSNPGDAGLYLLLAAIGVALALLGPGAWSIDARLFGWKRVEIRNGKGGSAPPF
jgi:putative oxidoreductase